MQTNFTSDTYSRPRLVKGYIFLFYSCSKSPLSRGPTRNKSRKEIFNGASYFSFPSLTHSPIMSLNTIRVLDRVAITYSLSENALPVLRY